MNIVSKDHYESIVEYLPEHRQMMENIEAHYPEINRATSLFGKSQSQFMDNLLTVANYTPLRNARQILAEMERTRSALKEAYFKAKKKEIEIKKKVFELEQCRDELDYQLIEIEIAQMNTELESQKLYVSGAIRKMSAYTDQYNSILKSHGKENFTEKDFEEEEEKYHIMKAFEQALCAARSHGGMIDEGNQIYLSQIGINGTVAQKCVSEYLGAENKLLSEGREPLHAMQIMFLEEMYKKFKGSAKKFLEFKGMKELSEVSLLEKGDTRLLNVGSKNA